MTNAAFYGFDTIDVSTGQLGLSTNSTFAPNAGWALLASVKSVHSGQVAIVASIAWDPLRGALGAVIADAAFLFVATTGLRSGV